MIYGLQFEKIKKVLATWNEGKMNCSLVGRWVCQLQSGQTIESEGNDIVNDESLSPSDGLITASPDTTHHHRQFYFQ